MSKERKRGLGDLLFIVGIIVAVIYLAGQK